MAIYLKYNGELGWGPDRTKSIINPGTKNEEKQYINTIASTARILDMLQRELVKEEDFYAGLSINAQHIGVSEDQLLELASEKLELDRQEKEA